MLARGGPRGAGRQAGWRGVEGWRTLRKHSTGAWATIGSSVVAGAAAEANTRAARGRAARVAAAAPVASVTILLLLLLLLLLRVKLLVRQASAVGRDGREGMQQSSQGHRAAAKSAAKLVLPPAARCQQAALPPPLAPRPAGRHNAPGTTPPPCLSWKRGGAGRQCLQRGGARSAQEAGHMQGDQLLAAYAGPANATSIRGLQRTHVKHPSQPG